MITDTQHTMDFDYSETQEMVAAAAKAFAHQHIAPHVRDWDEHQKFPIAVLKGSGCPWFHGYISARVSRWIWFGISRVHCHY